MAHWYAVYTRPRWEKKVADSFSRKKIESYCPLHKEPRQWLGRRGVGAALFPCCVFVRLEAAQLPESRKVDGVVSLLYWLGKPAVIRDIEVEMLRRFLSVHEAVVVEKTQVSPAAMVRLSEDPVPVHQEGGVVTVGKATATLLLPSLGYQLCSHQKPDHVNPFILTSKDLLFQ